MSNLEKGGAEALLVIVVAVIVLVCLYVLLAPATQVVSQILNGG